MNTYPVFLLFKLIGHYMPKRNKAIEDITWILILAKVQYVTEYKFSSQRKFRFDFAIPSKKIAIEYEGLMSKKSRHTTVAGYTKDCEKYNLAQIEGWRVLRYTVNNYSALNKDLQKILYL